MKSSVLAVVLALLLVASGAGYAAAEESWLPPQVEEGFSIEPGQPFVGRYRYLVYDGSPEAADLEGTWRNYATPPLTLTTDF